jgi:hypothetical protein
VEIAHRAGCDGGSVEKPKKEVETPVKINTARAVHEYHSHVDKTKPKTKLLFVGGANQPPRPTSRAEPSLN